MIGRGALALALVGALITTSAPGVADAFCGFYVAGADAKLYNNATQVVMMRKGTRTVLSMQNNYQGPPADFAMVIPVPAVLQEANVKTLPDEVFTRIDSLAAPRLVEYWEQDPCPAPRPDSVRYNEGATVAMSADPKPSPPPTDLGVTVEAKFDVGEYQIVILGARDSAGLETWLRQEKYTIPKGAQAFLRPYVETGSKFFVAKVNAQKVTFKDGMAKLSPLRFFYDSDEFTLPVRLGLMNAKGKQDLIVHILAPGQRYEVANAPNVTIPTNIDVTEAARGRFGEFYAALFDRTMEKHAGAVVTEYAWDARGCDPCPTPALNPSELMTFGGDVLEVPFASAPAKPAATPAKRRVPRDASKAQPSKRELSRPMPPPPPPPLRASFVLTRLHARYDATTMKDDLVFKAAGPIIGGREIRTGRDRTLENGSKPGGSNAFQARYAIRHPWEGKIECQNPRRGVWGGPPRGGQPQPTPALDLAFAPRTAKLASLVKQDVPEIAVVADRPAEPLGATGGSAKPATSGDKKKEESKGCSTSGGAGSSAPVFGALLIGLAWRRRRS